jgi:phosphoglycolate phosphatase-like HAD superfamily hydrolase
VEDFELPKAAIFDLDGTLLDSVDRRGPASSRAHRTLEWRRLPAALQSPIREVCGSLAFSFQSSAFNSFARDESPNARVVPSTRV